MVQERFVLLDALRGVAAIAVVMRHMPEFFPSTWLPSSHLAVDLFFVLSGFVIAHAYDGRLRSGMSWRAFMLARWVRLWPIFFVAALVGGAVNVAKETIQGEPTNYFAIAIPLSLLMIPTPVGPKPFPSVGAAWSLMFELIANALYAVLWRQLSTRVLILICAFSALGLAATAHLTGTADGGFEWASFWLGLFRVMYSFPMGVLLYRHRRKWSIKGAVPAIALALVVLCCFRPGAVWWQLLAVFTVLPAVVLIGSTINLPARTAAIAAVLGAISYPIYLFHPPVSDVLTYGARLFEIAPGPKMVALGFLAIVGLVVLSYCAEKFYDIPARRKLRERLGALRDTGRAATSF